MSSTQLSFALNTSSKAKTVHLVGSWDSYKGQLPLSCKEHNGKYKGTFRFSTSTLNPGSRYWYYYIVDGYHVTTDPNTSSTKEPTTGRSLNILNVAKSGAAAAAPASTLKSRSARQSTEIPKGRSLSPSKIACPKPSKPYASRAVREADYSTSPGMEDLTEKLEQASLYKLRNVSPPSSVGSSLSSRSSDRSSPSSLSSLSEPSSAGSGSCRCNRYGVTRKGDRVKLDCGGSRCGYSDDSSSACSDDSESESESENERPRYQEVRPRQAVSSGRRR